MQFRTKKIRGVNLGGWLLMEGYILGGINIAESSFKSKFKNVYGSKALLDFEDSYRNNFIKENDFKKISAIGANSIRVPFNYRLLEKSPYKYSKKGFSYLSKIFDWAKKYNLGVILDLHSAPGSQNHDWHSDSNGKALLWGNRNYQKRTLSLWEEIAGRFKEEPALIGYDLLNEPVLNNCSLNVLKKFYVELIKTVRTVDKNNLIFLEGDIWATRINFLKDLIGTNIDISIHAYSPLDYTFNFSPFNRFPGRINKVFWNKKRICEHLRSYFEFSQKNKVSIFVGEFGINWRGGNWGEIEWLKAILEAFDNFGFGYTYWTYKSIARSFFPDGIYQYIPNSKYINRGGFPYGWETYYQHWSKDKRKIIDFWKTENFTPNKEIISTLKKHFKR